MNEPSEALRWRQARALFEQAVDWAPEDWSTRLREICPDDPALRIEVLALLEADAAVTGGATRVSDRAPGLLGELLGDAGAGAPDPWPGQRLGVWRVQSCIGRGGMGRVYLAQRDDGEFRQQVALKLVDHAGDRELVARRLRSERQILAGLQHPNIAGLVDGGVSADGVPWFALEYVEGEPITRWCDRQGLGVARRLRLFLDVCAAVAHAHERLVVHRDLKPGNIMVDAEGRVKLLDFGIAKLLDATDAEGACTAVRIFTPDYAAPEQIRGEPTTTAVDVYALGVLLHELLTGCLPFQGGGGQAVLAAAVLDQEASRPSSLVVKTRPDRARTGTPQDRAARRASTPDRLRQQLRGDLDAIVLKALRPQPERRHDGVRALAADVRAVLERRPVAARQGGRRYQIERFLVRHALAVGLAGLAALSLLAGTAIALQQAHEAGLQRAQAQEEARKAGVVAEFLGSLFKAANPRLTDGRDPPASEVLARGAEALLARDDLDAATRSSLLTVMAGVHADLAMHQRGLELAGFALESAEAAGDPKLKAGSLATLARLANNAGDRPAAAEYLDRADAVVAAARLDDPALLDAIDHIAAVVHNNLRDLPRALGHLERSLARARSQGMSVPTRTVLMYSTVLTGLGRPADALSVTGPALAAARAGGAPTRHDLGTLASAHAFANLHSGTPEQAESLYREALAISSAVYGEESSYAATDVHNIRMALTQQGRHREAAELARESLRITRLHYSGNAPALLRSLAWTGIAEANAGDLEGALSRFQAVLAEDPQLMALAPRLRALAKVAYARALAAAADWPAAWALADQVLAGAGPSDESYDERAQASLRLVRLQATRALDREDAEDCRWLADGDRDLPEEASWRRQWRTALRACQLPAPA